MGGAESSPYQSVESLSTTMQEIHERLERIESLTFLQALDTAVDDCVIVNEIKVPARRNIRIITGPVLGTIGEDFTRIVLEIESIVKNEEIPIAAVLFKVDDVSSVVAFDRKETFTIQTHEVCSIVLTTLLPNTSYALYLGGVNADDIFKHYMYFRTLPTNSTDVNIAFVNSARLDSKTPDEIYLLPFVLRGVRQYNQYPQSNCAYSEQQRHLLSVVVFLGDFLSVDTTVDDHVPGILEAVIDYDVADSVWIKRLAMFQEDIISHYRSCYRDADFAVIGRSCCCLVMSDVGEKGSVALDRIMLSQQSPSDQENETSLKSVFTSLVSKVLREVYITFCRRLWDDDCGVVLQLIRADIDVLKSELSLRRRYIGASKSCDRAQATLERKRASSGVESAAATDMQTMLELLSQERDSVLAQLEQFMLSKPPCFVSDSPLSSSLFSSNSALTTEHASHRSTRHQPFAKHAVIQMSGIAMVILDSAWESNDSVLSDAEVCALVDPALDRLLKTDDPSTRAIANYASSAEVKAVIVLTPGQFASHSRTAFPSIASSFLTKLAKWQQDDKSRRVSLVVSSSEGVPSSCSGRLAPIPTTEGSGPLADPYRWVEGSCEIAFASVGICNGLSRVSASLPTDADADIDVDVDAPPNDYVAIVSTDDNILEFRPDKESICHYESFWVLRPTSAFVSVSSMMEQGDIVPLIGPVIGKITATSVSILFEVDDTKKSAIASKLRVEVNVTDCVSSLRVSSVRLVSRRRPSVFVIDGLHPGHHYDITISRVRPNRGEVTDSIALPVLRGSFTTPPLMYISKDVTSSDAVRQLRSQKDPTVTTNFVPSFNVMIVGSTVRHPQDGGAGSLDLELLDEVREVLSVPWSALDLVVHLGSSADLTRRLEAIVKALAEAEMSHESQDQHLADAEEALRDVYRLSWGANGKCRALLAHGQHLFISSPVLDILAAFDSQSLREIIRDRLSDFCSERLLSIVSRLQCEYQFYTSSLEPLYFCNGRLLGYTLQLGAVLKQDLLSTPTSDLVSVDQLAALTHWLSCSGTVEHLVIFSALPIIEGDVIQSEFAFQEQRLRCTLQDVKRILDTVTAWVMGDAARRKCTLVTGSRDIGFPIVITAASGLHEPFEITQVSCSSMVSPASHVASSGHHRSLDTVAFSSGPVLYTYKAVDTHMTKDISKPAVCILKFEKDELSLRSRHEYYSVGKLRKLRLTGKDELVTISRAPEFIQTFRKSVIDRLDSTGSTTPEKASSIISETVESVMEKHQDLLQNTHEAFVNGSFGIPVGVSRDSCLLYTAQHFLDAITIEESLTLLAPSSIVVELVWCSLINELIGGAGVTSDKERTALNVLKSHKGMFIKLLRDLYLTSLQLAVIANEEGYF